MSAETLKPAAKRKRIIALRWRDYLIPLVVVAVLALVLLRQPLTPAAVVWIAVVMGVIALSPIFVTVVNNGNKVLWMLNVRNHVNSKLQLGADDDGADDEQAKPPPVV